MESVVETIIEKRNGLHEEECAGLLWILLKRCQNLHVILDGLDECQRPVQRKVIKLLQRLTEAEEPNIKILITCREEGYLLKDLSTYRKLHISPKTNQGDIQSYISDTLEMKITSGDLCTRNEAIKEEIVSTLVAKAKGM